MDNPKDIPLRVFSKEEIEIFLAGDRREIDRLILHGLNNVAHILLPFIKREEELHDAIGNSEEIRVRVAYIDSLVARQKDRSRMMRKVAEATWGWAAIAFVGFIAYSVWEYVLNTIKQGGS